jgi:threonine/homoserine/homoserine lactone efflux protein
MTLDVWFAYVAASAILLVIPGPTILTVVSYALTHGGRAKVPLVVAVSLGDCTALFLSLVGLGSVLAASALLFTLVKWAGGLYLIFLGVRMLRNGAALPALEEAPEPASLWRLFFNTYTVTALNPKGIIFFVAFLPQFLNPEHDLTPQLWLLAFTFVALATLNATLYALFASSARRVLSSARAQRRFSLLGGCLLTAAGVWALLAKRAVHAA